MPIWRSIYLSSRSKSLGCNGVQSVSKIDELDDERQKLRIELRKSLDKLNETRTKLAKVREELQQLRKTRDGLNDTVRALKQREEITKQREEADQVHARTQELAAESQKHHEYIVQLSGAFQTLRAKRDEQQKSLDELRAKVGEINQHFVELRNELTDGEKRIRREKEEALKEALKGAAQRKLSKGEKLTLYELGALYEGEEE